MAPDLHALLAELGSLVAPRTRRWLVLSGEGTSLAIWPDAEACSVQGQPLSFSALPYSVDQLDRARHSHELEADGSTHLSLDVAQTGVGGDNSWGARPHPEFTLRGDREHRLVFFMKPVAGADAVVALRAGGSSGGAR